MCWRRVVGRFEWPTFVVWLHVLKTSWLSYVSMMFVGFQGVSFFLDLKYGEFVSFGRGVPVV